jgi:glycosyltransferase involved in cell wall biosynthesis
MKSVWIVQPYVPSYRVPFFERLASASHEIGIDLRVVASRPQGAQAERRDAADPPWLEVVEPHVLRLAGRSLVLTSSSRFWRHSDGVVLPLSGATAEVYEALVRQRRGGPAVGLWGHVKNYTGTPSRSDAWLERFQMRRSAQVFAYTPSGAEYARQQGLAEGRITTVFNTVELDGLRGAMSALTREDLARFRSEHHLTEGRVASFIGALDASKRIDFLAETLDVLWNLEPTFRLLVGGQGDQSRLLDPARARGQVVYLGPVGDRRKALMGGVSSVIVCPGRVGLIAVESLAMKVHMLTTNWPFHAPEIEYLAEGTDVTFGSGVPDAFAEDLLGLLSSGPPNVTSAAPDLAAMVSNFRAGLTRMLG